MLSVLYVDRSTGALRAYDDIRLGGLGNASAHIERQVLNAETAEEDTTLVASDPRE